MFLDEELDQIHSENYGKENCAILLLKAMINRMPKEGEVATINPHDFLNTIKRIDNSWKLFCKKHSGAYKEDAWRNWVLKSDKDGKFKKSLGW